jgi:K+-sensing histidine kinase KdpD
MPAAGVDPYLCEHFMMNDQSQIHAEEAPLDFAFVLASSVHDMKNSLGMLLTTLATMMEQSPPQNPEQEQTYAVLEYEAARINSELVQLLSLYRMQHEHLLVQIDEHHVIDVLEEQLARNDMLFRTRNIQVRVNCDEDLSWYFDGELIGGVINNILVNCARYCRNTLQITADIIDNQLCIAVHDDGAGYPASMLAAPHEVNAGVSFSSGSTRLGLLFAHRVAGLHRSREQRGYIRLANDGILGGGVFQLWLP